LKYKFQLFLLVLFGTCAGFLLAEVIVRYCVPSYRNILRLNQFLESERGKFTRYDRLLGWHGKENAENDFEWVDTRHHVVQNRFGYRGSEYEYQRTQKRRISVLGDSFVWGFGVEDRDIFTSIMEQRSNGSIEVINMGVSGYGNDQEYLLWHEKGYLWKPDDVIVVIMIDSDLQDNIFPMRYGYPKPVFQIDEKGNLVLTNFPVPLRSKPWQDPTKKYNIDQGGWVDRILRHSSVANIFINAASSNPSIRRYLESHSVIPPRTVGWKLRFPFYSTPSDQQTEKAWTIMFKLIDMIHADVTKNRARLFITIAPSIIQVYPELWDQFRLDPAIPDGIRLDPEFPNKRITTWCQERNIPVIDLLPGLKKAGESNPYLYFPLNRHWTRDGQEVVADIILNALQIRESHAIEHPQAEKFEAAG
jgi:lysophospholipase L1-like esterase